MQENRAKSQEWSQSATTKYAAALQKLRAYLRLRREQKTFVDSLDAPERTALSTAILSPVMDSVDNLLSNRAPDYIQRFDDLVIRGGPAKEDDGTPTFALEVGFMRKDKTLDVQFGQIAAGVIK